MVETTEIETSTLNPRHLRDWRVVPPLGLFLAGVFLLSDALSEQPIRLLSLLLLGEGCALLWFLAAPFIWRLSASFPLGRGGVARHLVLHLLASVAFATGMSLLFSPLVHFVTEQFYGQDIDWRRAVGVTTYYFLFAKVLYYWLVIGAQHAYTLSDQLNEQQVRAAQVEERLTRARLDVLRMQMSPHFLFNALNSIAAMIRGEDKERAAEIVARLGDALRSSLDDEDDAFTALEIELAHLENYVDIERCRFGERLRFQLDVPDELLELSVPRWVLQPIVENAMTHGLEADLAAGSISLRARQDGQQLWITVQDDGPGPGPELTEGIGLGNTRKRLQELYGSRASLTLESTPPRGTCASLRLPVQAELS